MRVVRGKVVGNTVVLEGEPLPEGTIVTVIPAGDEPWDLDDASWRELDEARAAIARGDFVADADLDAELDRANER